MAASNKAGVDSRVVEVDDVDADSSSNGHCRCCHCGAPGPDGSTSQSYLRMKKHLQQMLEEKRSSLTPERDLSSKIAHLNLDDHHPMEEIDSLVNFIEGRQHELAMRDPRKAAKKARKKQRKLEEEERAKQQVKQASSTVTGGVVKTSDQVPNGMVRIKHNPLTNSTVITPLYGPPPPSSNFFQQQPSSAPARVIANGPVQRQVTEQKSATQPSGSSHEAPVPLPTKPAAPASPQPQIPPSSSSSSGASPQMVTIRRVMSNLADPVVTVTLKGDTSDSDRVLFTLVNGQIQQHQSVAAAVPVAPTPPKPRPSIPVISESELALRQEQRKVKKKQKKLEKKEKKKTSKNSNAQQPQQQQASVVMQTQEPPRLQTAQYQNHFHSDNFSLDNLKLPPGITLTRVQEATTSFDTRQQQFPFQLLGSPPAKGKSTASDGKGKNFNAAAPIIVSQPNTAEPMGSFGGLAAPNVIVVDTRQIQEEQQHKQSSGRNPPVKMRSIGIQTGCSDLEEDETTQGSSATEALSGKQKKKLRKKEKKAQHIQEAKRKEQLTKNPPPETKAAVAPPPSGRLANGAAEPRKVDKKGKKKTNKNHSRTDDKWEENIFVPKSDLDLERGDMDDDERELEAFKRFCFNSVPPERKEKVRVHLNVKDIFGKKPSLAANCK